MTPPFVDGQIAAIAKVSNLTLVSRIRATSKGSRGYEYIVGRESDLGQRLTEQPNTL